MSLSEKYRVRDKRKIVIAKTEIVKLFMLVLNLIYMGKFWSLSEFSLS